MSLLHRWLWPVLLAPCLAAGQGTTVKTDQVRAELVAHAPEGVGSGKPLKLGLLIRHAPGWHTYWLNPGDSGQATTLRWELPAGTSAGAIEWPTPERLRVGPLVNYGYEGTLLLPVPVAVAPGFAASSLEVRLQAEWLVCKVQCLPQSGEFRLSVPAGASTASHAEQFERALAMKPRPLPDGSVRARVDARALALDVDGLPASLHGKEVRFFAGDAGVIDHAGAIAQRWEGERLHLRVPLSPQRSGSPATMLAVVADPAATSAGAELRFAVNGWPPLAELSSPVPPAPTAAATPLIATLALAFLGGLLLNLMPCVFPVLSLKVLGFAGHAHDRRQLVAGGFAYSVGVVLSFLGLAAAMLAFRAAGDSLGWGFQLQSPVFVAALALLFALIGLNLIGVFELPGLLPGSLSAVRARHPVLDHGLTGVLAVAIASPCTTPFMGAALGAALALPATQALAVFAALGAGMAAPYLAAALWPGLARRLPQPGAWMARFRTAMAFPMFATVIWLVWVLGQQTGIDAAAALLGLLLAIAFALWLFGTAGRGRGARTAVAVVAVAIVATAAAWSWSALRAEPERTAAAADARPTSTTWQPWSTDALARARADGRPVFVDFTAAWCITCQINKRATLSNAEVLQAFHANDVLLLRADWTRGDPQITEALHGLGRSGVPVYAFYAPGAAAPQLLSEILTVSEIRAAMSARAARTARSEPEATSPRLP
jgi:thiol:disulfide interchange protein/DsbC/DsbD-like thiol-disulfide interchange protein